MRYKAGDKVRIKTWERLNREGITIRKDDEIAFASIMEEELKKLPERVITISAILDTHYKAKEIKGFWNWTDRMIECIVIPLPEIFTVSANRFKLMDIDEV